MLLHKRAELTASQSAGPLAGPRLESEQSAAAAAAPAPFDTLKTSVAAGHGPMSDRSNPRPDPLLSSFSGFCSGQRGATTPHSTVTAFLSDFISQNLH